ncbi:hypothetical protein H5410_021032 [Solanum commersonii]|uniref:Uncharacterized protein n=1 Tax=Solanum commersonii TaxID=4109 RepID=A0A9J5ZCV0_SOLCO|nr:hypothetical protein H5410_021032 [Solanum commersonii]
MSVHNKTQFTYARINCVLKDSSCDTPLPKIVILAILATCASSSSTKRFIKVLPKKGKAQRVFKRVSHAHG